MYYAFEFKNGEWVEIGCGTNLRDLEAHCVAVGVEIFGTLGW